MCANTTHLLQEHVQTALNDRVALKIVAGNSKHFYGRATDGQLLTIVDHRGILNYEPSELVVTARAGTPLTELSQVLAEKGQWLGFEPPHFGETATLGGTIACGLSGPSRPYLGAVRDFVLGVKCLTGKGEVLKFGGQVMKNVAGYDVSRLLVGSLGTLAVLLDISCKVLPKPAEEITLVSPATLAEGLQQMIQLSQHYLPVTASCADGENLYLRLSGIALQTARQKIPGEIYPDGAKFWEAVREHRLAFFTGDLPLWRLSVPATTPLLKLTGTTLIEWGGALRWLRSELPAVDIRRAVVEIGGHATLFRGGDRHSEIFQPLPPALGHLHRRLKEKFDPHGILNPGRMMAEW
ncbi:MAG: glycolate oxidase subunit GlcE [Beggiatoa sp. IS2]|nr:MAG: glycolate oxidase subunit GlcE [Beggiatoa sp. IS2]